MSLIRERMVREFLKSDLTDKPYSREEVVMVEVKQGEIVIDQDDLTEALYAHPDGDVGAIWDYLVDIYGASK